MIERHHPEYEWLMMHYRTRHEDRHQAFLNRDAGDGSSKSAMLTVQVTEEGEAIAREVGTDAIAIAFCRKDVEENVIMMIERDDVGLEHRRQMLIPDMDKKFENAKVGTRLWEATCRKFSSYFTEEQARKCRQWAAASRQQRYNLEEDRRDGRFF